MKIKFNIRRLLFILSIVALNEPLILYQSSWHSLFAAGKWMALLYALYLLVVFIKTTNKTIWMLFAYYLLMLYPTLVSGGDTRVWFRILYMFMSMVIIVHAHMHIDSKFVIKTLLTLVTIYLFANFISLMMVGPDIVNGSYGGSDAKYVVGYRTRIGEWAYLGIMLSLLQLNLDKKKMNLSVMVLIVSVVSFVLINRVTTVIFLIGVFVIIKILADRGVVNLSKRLMVIFYGILALNVLMVGFNITENLSWLFVDILGEDVTLNSRTIIWQSAVYQIAQNPLFGYGVGHVYQFELRKLFLDSLYATSTHNQFLNVLYETGFFGFAIFFAYTRSIIKKFVDRPVSKAFNTVAATFIVFLISMTVEISGDNVMYFGLLMIMLNYDKIAVDEENTNIEKSQQG